VDITFPNLACSLITLDTSEVSGERHMNVHDGHLLKRRLDKQGNPIDEEMQKDPLNKFKEFKKEPQDGLVPEVNPTLANQFQNQPGALQALMLGALANRGGGLMGLFSNHFPDGIDQAFKNEEKEGCEVMGYLEVNRVAGQFHVSPGKSLSMGGMSIQLAVHSANINLTHHIKRLAFGENFPGSVNPLDGEKRSLPPGALHQYFLKVVPTTFSPLKGQSMSTNQYSVTESSMVDENGGQSGKPPGVYFTYELSPIRVTYEETRPSLGEFLTSVCAIIGGVFSVSGIVHRLIIAASH